MGARFLLDTNICIHVIKHNPPEVRRRFEQHAARDLAMSVVTFGELRFGAERSQHRALALERLDHLTRVIEIVSLPDDAGRHYGRIRAELEQQGRPIGGNDLWIAAHACAQGWVLVTNNGREFDRVNGLRLENWVNPS
jgi:tRNA(fMet)-specific endonuclease VapC